MNKFLIVLAGAAHLLPHPFGVSSIGATALYAGAYGRTRTFWLVPLMPLLLGNLIFGFYDLTVMAHVYVGFALSTLAGRYFLSAKRSYWRYGAAVVVGAVVFFLVSNFAIWQVGMYPPTIAGLTQCYVNGLPYLAQASLADAAYCFVLFGLHRHIGHRFVKPVTA